MWQQQGRFLAWCLVLHACATGAPAVDESREEASAAPDMSGALRGAGSGGGGPMAGRGGPKFGIGGDGSSPATEADGGNVEPDAGAAEVDAGAREDGGAPPDDGEGTAGEGGSSGGEPTAGSPAGECVQATRLWSEDFESSGYAAWTGGAYGETWGDACQSTARSTEAAVSGTRSQRSEIVCAYTNDTVHRGYGGIQFAGDVPLTQFTGAGTGIDAPHGVVNTFWVRLDSETVFDGGRWVSLFTALTDCNWSSTDQVITLGIEDASGRLAAAHYQWGAGGERIFDADAPSLPRGEWTRITIYLNAHDDEMHVWQDGKSVQHVTFDRALTTLCHFHWGLYASADNDDIVLFEDDNSVWKLGQAWTDFELEPYLGEELTLCE
jgi:hypothetical protein